MLEAGGSAAATDAGPGCHKSRHSDDRDGHSRSRRTGGSDKAGAGSGSKQQTCGYLTVLESRNRVAPSNGGGFRMSVVVRHQPTGLTKERYDEVSRRMEDSGVWPPNGLDMHVCFGSEGELRVSEIWDSEEEFRAFSRAAHAGVERGRGATRRRTRNLRGSRAPRNPKRGRPPRAASPRWLEGQQAAHDHTHTSRGHMGSSYDPEVG